MNPMCSWCASDEYIDDYDAERDEAWCTGPGHPEPRMFEPKKEAAARAAKEKALSGLSFGIAHELGLYEDLVEVLRPGQWMETGAVEYCYGVEHPEIYRQMLDRWGHVAQSPRKYSVTSFIGSTLGQLSRWTNVTYRSGPGTGFFSYNRWVGYWTLEPVPDDAATTSWEVLARSEGLDPSGWPLV